MASTTSATGIVTLDNFASRLPQWDPSLPSHLYALVDMGSNGIRFSISDLSPPRARLLKCLYHERAAVSLFDALNKSASSGPLTFPSDVIAQVSRTLARFRSTANDYGVPYEHISVFATEAMRKAENAASMLDAILASSGLDVHVLAPEVETLFGAMGARSQFTSVNGLFLDLGGGSVQMTYLDSSVNGHELAAAQTGKSLPFGAARLTDVLENGNVEAQATSASTLQEGMRDAFAKLQQQFPSLRDAQNSPENTGIDIYLCGGGFRGYGSILMHADPIQPYPIPTVGGYTVQGAFFNRTKDMRKINAEYEDKIFGMSKRRRRQFPAIVTVVEALVAAIPRIRTATFCSGGNREGALSMILPKHMREEDPLPLLSQVIDNGEAGILRSVIHLVQSSLPSNFDISSIPTVFSLGLGTCFIGNMWARIGESNDVNASLELNQAVTRDSSTPGLTHLARAVLGLTQCYRWGANLSPADRVRFVNLQKLVGQSNPEANFWAEYIGTVASLLTIVYPAKPSASDSLRTSVKFRSTLKRGSKKEQVQLDISLSPAIYESLNVADLLASHFKHVGKQRDVADKTKRKVEVVVHKLVY